MIDVWARSFLSRDWKEDARQGATDKERQTRSSSIKLIFGQIHTRHHIEQSVRMMLMITRNFSTNDTWHDMISSAVFLMLAGLRTKD